MASCTIQKHSITETAAKIDHNNIDREGQYKKHKNPDINPELCKYNVYLDKRNKREILDDIEADVASIDEKYPPKKKQKAHERIVVLQEEFTAPREIAPVFKFKPTKEEEDALVQKYVLDKLDTFTDYFKEVEEVIRKKYGKTYGATIHFDECHYYRDRNDGLYHMSRPHLHVFVTAQAEIMEKTGEKDDKGKDIYTGTGQYRINGKDALKRSTYKEINKLLDAPSQKYYGCTYEDGRGKKSEGSVEAMKAASIRAEQEAHERLKEQNKDIRVYADAVIEKLDALDEQITENSKTLLEQETQKSINKEELSDLEDKIADKNTELFMKDKPKFKRDKVLVDKEAFEAYQEYYNSHKEQKLRQEQKDLADDKKKLEADRLNFNQQKAQYKYKAEGQYKEKAQKYDSLKADFEKRLEKMKKNPLKSSAQMSGLIHEYALLKVSDDKERAAILKACEALDTLDAYHTKIESKIPFFTISGEEDIYSRQMDFLREKVKEEYTKLLKYGGRKEMYSEISDIWKGSKELSSEIYQKYGSKHKHASSVNTLQTQYTPLITGILSDLLSLVRIAFQLVQEASRGYDR